MKKRKQPEKVTNSTPAAVAVAALVAAGAIQAAEVIYSNMRDSEFPGAYDIPLWRAHMASICAGSISFVVALFLLENLGKQSRAIAFRSVVPWLPIVGLTMVATAIHIPVYLVILGSALYSPWAYFRTRAVR